MKKFLIFIICILSIVFLVSCRKLEKTAYDAMYEPQGIIMPNGEMEILDFEETYNESNELKPITTEKTNESYFTMDSSTAGYSNIRRLINSGNISNLTVRTDEMLNYFSYEFEATDETFTSKSEISVCPWDASKYFLTIGIKTKKVVIDRYSQGNNFVFLVDVSGSMRGESRIELVKKSINMLIENLNDNDKISIVTYASGVNTICSGINASEKTKLTNYIDKLTAGGATSGEQGLRTAYNECEKHLINGGNNRIIICSDGDFNVGINNTTDLKEYMQDELKKGIYVTTLGFGMGNYRDDMMETIAKNGNGVFAFIDSLDEARKVLVDEMDNSLYVVAKDVKSKVVFNTDIVSSYRLIGYESKTITKEEYENNEVDSLELGSNSTTMVCYELELKDTNILDNLVTLDIKYKDPLTNENKLYQNAFSFPSKFNIVIDRPTEDHIFASCVVEFSLIIRNSQYKANANIGSLIERLESLDCVNNDYYKKGFLQLVEKYNSYLQ